MQHYDREIRDYYALNQILLMSDLWTIVVRGTLRRDLVIY